MPSTRRSPAHSISPRTIASKRPLHPTAKRAVALSLVPTLRHGFGGGAKLGTKNDSGRAGPSSSFGWPTTMGIEHKPATTTNPKITPGARGRLGGAKPARPASGRAAHPTTRRASAETARIRQDGARRGGAGAQRGGAGRGGTGRGTARRGGALRGG
eukprot:scaffold15390_cov97-Phaeocystis_antarctica.AAC.1